MSKLGLVIVMMLMAGRNHAQNYPARSNEPLTYFVLIQSDDGAAFYVRLDERLFSSSSGGHLILSRLKDSVYTITVGLPGQTNIEQRYLLNIHKRDWSLRLSRRDDRWGLYDGHSRALPAVADSNVSQRPLPGVKRDDPFSQMMSAIVRDTAVMYSTYATYNAAPVDSTPAAASKSPTDTVPASPAGNAGTSSYPTALSSPTGDIPSSPTGVMKLSEYRSTQSLSILYMDHPTDKNTDTIDVVIPIDSSAVTRQTAIPFVNSDCHAFATAYDVDKLRVRLLNTAKDADRIQAALKVFKTKCFTTKQVGALSEVFITDASKFKFLATAYPFVSDEHFAKLENCLSNPVYIEKFRTLTNPH